VVWALDPAARTVALPALVWQPLVENAVRHGIARRATPGRLLLAARHEGTRLRLVVDADGPDAAADDTGPEAHARFGGLGLGLRTTQRRLALLYGERASLTLDARRGGTCVELVLPIASASDAEWDAESDGEDAGRNALGGVA
jgi:LytS/YehU family sensor histidine kinase